jgi:hypothetical protein
MKVSQKANRPHTTATAGREGREEKERSEESMFAANFHNVVASSRSHRTHIMDAHTTRHRLRVNRIALTRNVHSV